MVLIFSCKSDDSDLKLLEAIIKAIPDVPQDWTGNDYCHDWTGITCVIDQNKEQRLQKINLTHRGLFGTLPATGWKKASRLTTVKLSHNNLFGSVPEELLGIFQGNIFLDNNLFTGNLPGAPARCSLQFLHLQANKLTGCVPVSYRTITTFCKGPCQGLNLANNYFNCSNPSCMANLPTSIESFCPYCPPTFQCEEGKYCWNIPPTIVLMITLMCGGFVFGSLAMFFANKYLYKDGFHDSKPKRAKSTKHQHDVDQSLINSHEHPPKDL